jgi:hypothetical protein
VTKKLYIMAPVPINIAVSPGIAPPLVCTGGLVTLEEDNTNSPGSFESENNPNPPAGLVWVTANDKIQTDQNLRVNIAWTMSGLLNPFLNADYICTVYFEKMGIGEVASDFTTPLPIPHVPTAGSHSYNVNIDVPAGSLSVGVYRLVVSVTTQSTGSGIGFPIVGFCDCDLIQVYQS